MAAQHHRWLCFVCFFAFVLLFGGQGRTFGAVARSVEPRSLADIASEIARTKSLEPNVPVHIQISKHLASIARRPKEVSGRDFRKHSRTIPASPDISRIPPEVLQHIELFKSRTHREDAASRVQDEDERVPHPNTPVSFDRDMTSYFAELEQSLDGAKDDIIIAQDAVDAVDSFLRQYNGLSRVSLEGSAKPAHNLSQLDAHLTELASLIMGKFGQLMAELRKLNATANSLIEVVPMTESSIINLPEEGSVSGICLYENLMAVGMHSSRCLDEYCWEIEEQCDSVFIYEYGTESKQWQHINTLVDEVACMTDGVGSGFGRSIVMQGNHVIIGSPYKTGFGDHSGKVHVFLCDHGRDCSLVQTLMPTLEMRSVIYDEMETETETPSPEPAYSEEPTETPSILLEGSNVRTARRFGSLPTGVPLRPTLSSMSMEEPTEAITEAPTEEPSEVVLPDDQSQWTYDDWWYYCYHNGGFWEACSCYFEYSSDPWFKWYLQFCPVVNCRYCEYGMSLAMDGNVLVVGSPMEINVETRERLGAVYLYRFEEMNAMWMYEAKDYGIDEGLWCDEWDWGCWDWYYYYYYHENKRFGKYVASWEDWVGVGSRVQDHFPLYKFDTSRDRWVMRQRLQFDFRATRNIVFGDGGKVALTSPDQVQVYTLSGAEGEERWEFETILHYASWSCSEYWCMQDDTMFVATHDNKIAVLDIHAQEIMNPGVEQGLVYTYEYNSTNHEWRRRPPLLMASDPSISLSTYIAMTENHFAVVPRSLAKVYYYNLH